MTIVPFSFELAQSLCKSEEQFPVDFDFGWQWLGYSTKSNAKRVLEKSFEKDVDYVVFINHDENSEGRPREHLRLSTSCLKEMGMMAGTKKGKEVRQYFLTCEAIY